VAVILYGEPAVVSDDVVQVATPPVSATFPHNVTGEVDPFGISVKVAVPVGVPPPADVTVAVKVTWAPEVDGLSDEATVVVVGIGPNDPDVFPLHTNLAAINPSDERVPLPLSWTVAVDTSITPLNEVRLAVPCTVKALVSEGTWYRRTPA
jgi:hypothetical protein